MDEKLPKRPLRPNFLSSTRFSEFELPHAVMEGLNDAGFEYCTPIQAQTLALSLKGKDVAGQAQTGTGKTAAFMVTVFARLLSLPQTKTGMPSALIVAPTRELAIQIFDDARVLGSHTNLNTVSIVGGIDYQKQATQLRKGADIVICTPGRIIDYLKQGIFKPDEIKIVVIDEADRLFDLGFTRDMRYILKKLPSYEKRQSMLFSATLSYKILALTYDYMNLPDFISVTPDEITVKGVEQVLYHVGKNEKFSLLLGLLERENWTRVLIFMNTKSGVEWLTKKLQRNKLPAEGITGDLPQQRRLQLMKRFKDNDIKILIATDVASRGIHVEDISHAINYDLPQDAENYIHRIGRTARAGKTGRALSLACEEYIYHLAPIEELLGYKIPIEWPGDDWFLEDKAGPVKIQGRTSEKKFAPIRPKDKEKKEEHRAAGPRMAAMSSQPGGVFGLAPVPKKESVSDHPGGKSAECGKKRRKRRSRRKSAA